MLSDALTVAADGRPRCFWAGGGAPEYAAYHDEEWGRPVLDDDRLFERLTLEAFQSGLSWLTILRKRPAFRAAFAGFHIPAVAAFGVAAQDRLLGDAGIVRNRLKIEAAIANARAALPVIEEHGSLAALFWHFRFVGPTTAYSLMQAAGIVNDHVDGCAVFTEVESEQVAAASRFA